MDRIVFNQDQLIKVDIDQIKPNTWNPKDDDAIEYQKVLKSVKTKGYKLPIRVREVGKDKYEIIDGEQRWKACKELGFSTLLVYNEGKMDDKEAREDTIWWEQHVPSNTLEIANLMTDMAKKYGLEKLITPYELDELQEMVKLSEFEFPDDEPSDNEGGSKEHYVVCPNCKTKFNVKEGLDG